MKRPPGAIPPLTEQGLKTLEGKKFAVRLQTIGYRHKVRWKIFKRLKYHTEHEAIFELERIGRVAALGQVRFDSEDELVASIRRARFLAKLNASAA